MKTRFIIFSKDRTLQLKSLLLSLKEYSDIPEENINILYVASEGISYDLLKEQFNCNFVEQKSFLRDIRNLVKSNDSDYIGFMVDDLIFRNEFNVTDIEKLLDENSDIDSFCPRMGLNIKGNRPEFDKIDQYLVWNTAENLGKHWNYFWDLSSSIFRKDHVMKYLDKCRNDKETFPNPLEYHYYACMPSTRIKGIRKIINSIRFALCRKYHKIACFEKSVCCTLGVNLVANLGVDREEQFSTESLHRKLQENFVVNFKVLKDIEYDTPNAGHKHFQMIKEEEL